MPKIKIINSEPEACAPHWINVQSFKSLGRLVDETGQAIGQDHQGRCYRIVAKHERSFPLYERIGRLAIAISLTLISLGIALKFKSIRQLYTKTKESERFARLYEPEPSPVPEPQQEPPEPPQIPAPEAKAEPEEIIPIGAVKEYTEDEVTPLFLTPYKRSGLGSVNFLQVQTENGPALIVGIQKEGKTSWEPHDISPLTLLCVMARKYPKDSSQPPFLTAFSHPLAPTLFNKNALYELICLDKELKILKGISQEAIEDLVSILDVDVMLKSLLQIGYFPLTSAIVKNFPERINLMIQAALDLTFHNRENALMLKKKIEQEHALTPFQRYLLPLVDGSFVLSERDFKGLNFEQQYVLYYYANAFVLTPFVKKIKEWLNLPVAKPSQGPHIFSYRMDSIDARDQLEQILKGLREKGQFLTREEEITENLEPFSGNLGHILASNFLAYTIGRLHLEHISTPRLTLQSTWQVLEVGINRELEPQLLSQGQYELYREKISPSVSRAISLDEALELAQVLVETRYQNGRLDDFIIADDHIVIKPLPFSVYAKHKIDLSFIEDEIPKLLKDEDQEAFKEAFAQMKSLSDDNPLASASPHPYHNLILSLVGRTSFRFSVDALIKDV